jgi:hypothetical protein
MWSYWQRTLAQPLPLLNVPIDFKRPPTQTYKGAFHLFPVPSNVVRSVRRFLL